MADINGLFSAISRRDPSKRQIKPVNADQLALLEELDDDSDSEYLCDDKDSDDSGDDDNSCEDTSSNGSEESKTDSESNDSEDEKTNEEVPMDPSVQETNNEGPNGLKTESVPEEVCQAKDSGCATGIDTVLPTSDPIRKIEKQPLDFMICTLCLGDRSDPNDELIECDGCGIVVHEDCYKVIDSIFMSSGASSSSTDAWFCEPCLAGVSNPLCELCPNVDGAFKRTDNSRWIHLLCALYTPGVAFNDTENLMDVTLTELPLKAWSQHECSLCDERFFAWTGVCISCDAGLCRTFFHVTCAQKYGLLSEPVLDEHTIDPYFAHCRQHTEKSVARQRRRNYLTSMSRVKAWRLKNRVKSDGLSHLTSSFGSPQTWILDSRIERKLENFRVLYFELRKVRENPYVPTSKTPLYLETSPVAMRLFVTKAKALHLPTELTGQSTTSESTRNPSSGYPTFSPDFISYFFEREKKINEVLKHISYLQNSQRELQIADAEASHSYNSVSTQLEVVNKNRNDLYDVCRRIMTTFQNLVPEIKASAELEAITSPSHQDPLTSSDRATAYSTQLCTSKTTLPIGQGDCHLYANSDFVNRQSKGLGRSLSAVRSAGCRIDRERISPDVHMTSDRLQAENVIMSCFVCQGIHEQHLITKCDTCPKAFHLACLDPPLLRMPKRSRLYAWQCSYCTKAVSAQSEVVTVDVDAPRQLRRSIGPSAPRVDRTSDKQVPNSLPTVEKETRPTSDPTDVTPEIKEVTRSSGITRRRPSLLTTSRQKAYRGRLVVARGRNNRLACTESTSTITSRTAAGGGDTKTTVKYQQSTTPTIAIRTSRLRVVGPGGRRRRSTGNPLDAAHFTAAHPAKRSCERPDIGEPSKSSQFISPSIDVPKPEGDANTRVCQMDVHNLSAYDYPQEQNSDDNGEAELPSLRTPKVVKYIQIHGHGDVEDETESVEQIAPLYPHALQRYIICRDTAVSTQTDVGSATVSASEAMSGGGSGNSRKSSFERFRMKLKKV